MINREVTPMVFNYYAQYYNLLYKDKDYQKEADYIQHLIRQYSNTDSQSVIDFGCGTGIHASFLSAHGYQVDGVDLSEQMIRLARQKETDTLHFHVGDITTVNLKKKVDVVVSLFHVFSYINSNDDVEKLLDNVSCHLKSGGLFIFDCWYGPAVLTDRPAVRVKRFEDENFSITRIAEPVLHPNDNIVDVKYEITVEEKRGKPAEKISEVHSMRYFFQPELELFLHDHGFFLVRCEEWMTGNDPGFGTWGVCWIARKK